MNYPNSIFRQIGKTKTSSAVCLHKHNHQLLKHQFANSTFYFDISKIMLENINGHERCQNSNPRLNTHSRSSSKQRFESKKILTKTQKVQN
jgi:hypothetical protein